MSKHITVRSKKLPFSFHIPIRGVVVAIALMICSLALIVISNSVGSMHIPLADVVHILLGGEDEMNGFVIMELRLPRTIVAFLVGAALAVAGSILQGVIRNPLAAPELLGVTGGASVGAIGFMTLTAGEYSINWLPVVAICGAFIAAALNYVLAWKKGVSPYRLVLVGIGISTGMGALTTFLLVYGPAHLAEQVISWLSGTVYGTTLDHMYAMAPWICILIPVACFMARHLNVQTLGDSVATGVGNPVEKSRFILLLFCVALSGAAVGIAGGISFIGLMAPHMARKLVGPMHGMLLPTSAFLGGIIMILADLAGRLIFQPHDLPAGIFTAGIGAPFFLYLLYTSRHK
ncbi:FecCD family ABC transporter permease [Paenibacillus sp. 481]|uniref:FecCD family ABC transporter permease n=1 Tax=Paenibacillus sp. 481 TaxID=2835869 RepID=UPI001E42A903|nr:iron ABC transporter permease [Paenibacillus sp. 481]UHA73801.1 iron ABC transporter permease [Paenibacillus sp. 481]